MAQRSLIDMMNAVSTNSDSEFRDSDFPPLPPGEAPKAAEQPQGGAAAGRRRPRKDVEKMTASPATSKQRESRLTHENLGSDPGAPPPQLSNDAKMEMTAAAVAAAAAEPQPRAAARAAAAERWATAPAPADPFGRRPTIPLLFQPPGATGAAAATQAGDADAEPAPEAMVVDDTIAPARANETGMPDADGGDGGGTARPDPPSLPHEEGMHAAADAAFGPAGGASPPGMPPGAENGTEMDGNEGVAAGAAAPAAGKVHAPTPTLPRTPAHTKSDPTTFSSLARRASRLLCTLLLSVAVAATDSRWERRHFGNSRPHRVSYRVGQDLVPVRYYLPGNETPIPSGLITRVCDGELTIVGISTPPKRMGVIPIRKGAQADLGPWMNVVTPEAKTYLLDLASIFVQLETGEELELKVQDCDAKGDIVRPAPTADQTQAREAASEARAARQDAEWAAKRQQQRKAERARQVIVSYDLPAERLGRLLEERELEDETKLVKDRAAEVFGDMSYDLRFHQPEDDEYGYALNQFTAYFTLAEGATYADTADKDFTGLKFLPITYSSRPLVAYMPKGISDQLGLARCCFQPQATCDAGRTVTGKCSVKEAMLSTAKSRSSVPARPLPPLLEKQRVSAQERKRARRDDARDSFMQAELERIRKRLCSKYVNGEVRTLQHAHTACALRPPCPAVPSRRPREREVPRAPQAPQLLARIHRMPISVGRTLHVLVRDGGQVPLPHSCITIGDRRSGGIHEKASPWWLGPVRAARHKAPRARKQSTGAEGGWRNLLRMPALQRDRSSALCAASGGEGGEDPGSPLGWMHQRGVRTEATVECQSLPSAPACFCDAHRRRSQSSYTASRSGRGLLQGSTERTGSRVCRMERPVPPCTVDGRRSRSSLASRRNRSRPVPRVGIRLPQGSAARTRIRVRLLKRPVPNLGAADRTPRTFPYLWHSYAILIIKHRLPWLGHGLATSATPSNN